MEFPGGYPGSYPHLYPDQSIIIENAKKLRRFFEPLQRPLRAVTKAVE